MSEWLQTLLSNYGYPAIFLVLFFNNLCIPLPGTTLILAAGFLAGTGALNVWEIVGTAMAACFLGTSGGYVIGRRYGAPLLEKIKWLKLTQQRFYHMEHFFKRYGPKGVFFARFVSVLHPVIGLLSGIGKTPVRPFLFYNIVGSAGYALIYTLVGKYFGQKWGFQKLWHYHMALYIVILAFILAAMSFYWRHSVHTFFGHTFFKKRRGGFLGKN